MRDDLRLGELCVRAEASGGVRILRLDGELDIASAPPFKEVLLELANRASELVLDLSGVRFMDTSGVDALLSGCATARCRPCVVGMRPSVARVVRVAGAADRPPFVS